MRRTGRHLFAIVELPHEEHLSVILAREAYRASRYGPVALLLQPGSRRLVDQVLDPTVSEEPHLHGVRYVDPGDESPWAAASEQTIVIGTSAGIRQRADALGARCVEPGDALALLREVNRSVPATPSQLQREG